MRSAPAPRQPGHAPKAPTPSAMPGFAATAPSDVPPPTRPVPFARSSGGNAAPHPLFRVRSRA
eukprot:3820327-Prorocentrum_lima.AAC.1